MRFLHPEMLVWLLSVPLLGLIAWYATVRRRRALNRFAGGSAWSSRFDDQVSLHRRLAKGLLWLFALVAVIFAFARPQWGVHTEEVEQSGVDVVVVLDTSLSMAAEDISPNRLEVALNGIREMLDNLGGDRVALVTFAGQPALACPLTVDHGAVRLFLDVVEPEVMQIPGTALADAIRTGVQTLVSSEDDPLAADRSRAMVLITDGEDHEGELDSIVPLLREQGVVVHAIGVGTTRGAPIPLFAEDGTQAGFKKDREGRIVTTRLEEGTLQTLALDTGGHYYLATPAGREINELTKSLGEMAVSEFGSALRTRYRERFQWPLGFAIVALILQMLIGDRRSQGRAKREAEEMR